MYIFEKQESSHFVIHKSYQTMGDKHHKKFGEQVTPQNQATLNVYVQGQFKLKAANFEQVMEAGQTSLEVALEAYPGGQVFEEEVISASGTRFCIARKSGGPWQRAKINITGETVFPESSLIVVLSGEINGQGVGSCFDLSKNQPVVGSGTVIRCWV